jgi:hypothetical protein
MHPPVQEHILVVAVVIAIMGSSTIPTMDKDTIPTISTLSTYTSVPLSVLQMCQELTEISMIDAFGKRPFPWQKAIIAHLNLMTCPASGIPLLPTFLCAPTGGLKLMRFFCCWSGQCLMVYLSPAIPWS